MVAGGKEDDGTVVAGGLTTRLVDGDVARFDWSIW